MLDGDLAEARDDLDQVVDLDARIAPYALCWSVALGGDPARLRRYVDRAGAAWEAEVGRHVLAELSAADLLRVAEEFVGERPLRREERISSA